MEKIKEVIVVEGKDDTRRLKELFLVDTIETNGSEISKETLELIKKLSLSRGVIVLTDPDHSGEMIRKIITREVPSVKHAFITKAEGVPKKSGSLGVEHASDKALIRALNNIMTPSDKEEIKINSKLLYKYGLTIGNNAKKRRKYLGEKLNIGYTNAKQLQKRLAMFQITEEELINAMKEIEKEFMNE